MTSMLIYEALFKRPGKRTRKRDKLNQSEILFGSQGSDVTKKEGKTEQKRNKRLYITGSFHLTQNECWNLCLLEIISRH